MKVAIVVLMVIILAAIGIIGYYTVNYMINDSMGFTDAIKAAWNYTAGIIPRWFGAEAEEPDLMSIDTANKIQYQGLTVAQ